MDFTEIHFNRIDNGWLVTFGHRIGELPGPHLGDKPPQNVASGTLAFSMLSQALDWISKQTAPPAQPKPAKETK